MPQQDLIDDVPLVPSAAFSTGSLAPGQRYEAWRQLVGMTHDIDGPDGRSPADGFAGSLVSAAIDRMVVRVMESEAQTVQRSPQRCRRDGLDHVTLHVATAPFEVETATDTFRVLPGMITVNTLARPFRRSAAPERGSPIVSVSRDLVAEHLVDPERFHGTVLSGGAAAAILSTHMTALCAQMRDVAMSEAPALATATTQLLAAALASSRDAAEAARPAAQAAMLVRCKTYIAQHLRSPDLTPEAICRGVGISRAALYRLFQPSGGAANYFREERLRAVRDTIVRSPVRPNIAELAYSYGFTNISAFNRMFRSAFGVAPSDVRRLETQGSEAPRIYRDWLRTFG